VRAAAQCTRIPEGLAMTAWTEDELARIGTAEELEIASLRRDGTLGGPRTIRLVPRARTTEGA
jgi:hypothetical protein